MKPFKKRPAVEPAPVVEPPPKLGARAADPMDSGLVVIVEGDPACPHWDTQLIAYSSPWRQHKVWWCPVCYRTMRHAYQRQSAGDWTPVVAVVPSGIEGALLPYGSRGWKMPS